MRTGRGLLPRPDLLGGYDAHCRSTTAASTRRLLTGAFDVDTARLVSDALGLGRGRGTTGSSRDRGAGQVGPRGFSSGSHPGQAATSDTSGDAVPGAGTSLEHVRQGLLTVHTLLSTMVEPRAATSTARTHAQSAGEGAAVTSVALSALGDNGLGRPSSPSPPENYMPLLTPPEADHFPSLLCRTVS